MKEPKQTPPAGTRKPQPAGAGDRQPARTPEQPNRTLILAIVAGVLIFALIIGLLFARSGNEEQDRLTDEQLAEEAAANPEERCGSQATYDLIKRDLFRRAAELRGSDQSAFDQLSAHAAVRMERPVMEAHDEELGAVRCSGLLTLDLPPGVAAVGGRRSLVSEIDYTVQPAADRSGNVVMIGNADPIITPLATLSRTGQPAREPEPEIPPTDLPDEAPAPAEPVPGASPSPQPSPEPPSPPASDPQPNASANPSFNCRLARTDSEIEICRNPGLAALDRQMAAVYNRAVQAGDAEQRALLRRTRDRFLRFREACGSERCMADAYRGRIREISDIMAGRWQPPR